jgi:hypothetical protein
MLLIINGQCYERRVSIGADRLVMSAAAFDGLPAQGHAILIHPSGVVYSFDYKMVWGNLKWTCDFPTIYNGLIDRAAVHRNPYRGITILKGADWYAPARNTD